MSRHLDGTGTGHPILACLDLLEAGLDQVTDTPAWSLNAEETEAAITRLSADLARLSEVETRLLGQAEALDLPGQLGARSLSAWLAEKDTAEKHLIGEAAHFDAYELRRLGEKLFEVLDPETVEESGTGVSPGQLIRVACEAKVFPAVLDKGGHVLDLGRGQRFHNAAQRLALLVEQQHCQHPSCDMPGAFCHVHHTTPWSDGGHTSTRDAVLMCLFHHHQAHATGQTYPIRT